MMNCKEVTWMYEVWIRLIDSHINFYRLKNFYLFYLLTYNFQNTIIAYFCTNYANKLIDKSNENAKTRSERNHSLNFYNKLTRFS